MTDLFYLQLYNPICTFTQCVAEADTLDAAWKCSTADAFTLSFCVMIAMTVYTFSASFVTNNDSWVDRLWSIIPVVYAWIFALFPSSNHQAPLTWRSTNFVFSVLVTMWGIRLTYNFYRRGGYRCGGEDYRWAFVRKWPIFCRVPFLWTIFSFIIVSFFQSWLLWAITLPLRHLPSTPLTTADSIFGAGFIFFLSLETLTDQQQWEFQSEKRNILPRRRGVDYSVGFCIDGVFAFSRHLNVFSEQSIWCCVFFASGSHTAMPSISLLHPSALGCIVLVALTIGSTTLTEKISSSKYPMYRLYQKTTPMLIPTLRATDKKTAFLIAQRSQREE